jgi:hypothetical protein
MKTNSPTSTKQQAASHQRLVACVALILLFAGFIIVCVVGNTTLGALAMYTALVSGVAKVAVEFFKCIRA